METLNKSLLFLVIYIYMQNTPRMN